MEGRVTKKKSEFGRCPLVKEIKTWREEGKSPMSKTDKKEARGHHRFGLPGEKRRKNLNEGGKRL